MTDFALQELDDGSLDLVVFGGDLLPDDSLRPGIAASLLTDREWPDAPDGDRRGSWQDSLLADPADRNGSWLWRLNRAKKTPQTLADAKQYAQDALAWLLQDGIASAVTVAASWDDRGLLQLDIEVSRPQGVQRYRLAALWQKSLGASPVEEAQAYAGDISRLAAFLETIYYIEYPEATL